MPTPPKSDCSTESSAIAHEEVAKKSPPANDEDRHMAGDAEVDEAEAQTEGQAANNEGDLDGADAEPAKPMFSATVSRSGNTPVTLDGDDTAAVLNRCLSTDGDRIGWAGADEHQAVVLSLEPVNDQIPLAEADDVESFFSVHQPLPLVAYVTRTGGLKSIFISVGGVAAVALAAAFYFFGRLGHAAAFCCKVSTSLPHPLGRGDGAALGGIYQPVPSNRVWLPGNSRRIPATDEQISEFLRERGLDFGRCTSTECPMPGCGRVRQGQSPVMLYPNGIKCFKCDSFRHWDSIVGQPANDNTASIAEAARLFVHIAHQMHVLRDLRPNAPAKLIHALWEFCLRAVHADALENSPPKIAEKIEANIRRALNPKHIDLVRSVSGLWLQSKTLLPAKLTTKTAKEAPCVRSGRMVDSFLDTLPLDGFVPVFVVNASAVMGPYFVPPEGAILVRREPRHAEPPLVDLSERPTDSDVEGAWRSLAAFLPGIHRGYLSTLIAQVFFAQRADAPPPMVTVTGDTGSGKTATVAVAGAMIGAPAVFVGLHDSKDTARDIGLALEGGAGILVFDEIGRTKDVYSKLEVILKLNTEHRFRALYRNECTIPMTAPVAILGSTLPAAVSHSPELSRRSVGFRLTGKHDWEQYGDLGRLRTREEIRPALDIITSSIWWSVHDAGSDASWRALCEEQFGAGTIESLDCEDGDRLGRDQAICDLYEHYRTAPCGQLTEGSRWKGWLQASLGTRGGLLLGELVDFEGSHAQSKAETSELERLNLAPILGFDEPTLRLLVRRRSGQWLVRFREIGRKSGEETPRESLPDSRPPKGKQERTIRTATHGDTHDASSENDKLRTIRTPLPSFLDEGASRGAAGAGSPLLEKGWAAKPCASCVASGSNDFDTGEPCASPCAARAPIFVDFETRSAANLSKVGGRLYAEHPSTEVVCAVALLPSGEFLEWVPGHPCPPALSAAVESGVAAVVHNWQGFDRHIWGQLGWPEPIRIFDSVMISRQAGLPGSLDELGRLFYGRGKDAGGKEVTLGLSQVDQRTGRMPPITPGVLATVINYCRRDVELLSRLWWDRLCPFAETEEDVRLLDQKINDRGFCFDRELAEAVVALEGLHIRRIVEAAPVPADLLHSPKKLQKWLKERGVGVANAQRGTLEELAKRDDLPEEVAAVLKARITASRITTGKLKAGLRATHGDGRARDSLVYHGAHTGRWAGKGMQPHNLPGGLRNLDLEQAIKAALERDLDRLRELAQECGASVDAVFSSLVRPCIVAPRGKLLGIVDYSNIEARVLLWLVGDDHALDLYRQGEDAYARMASMVYGVEPGSIKKPSPERKLGKSLVLGCGYQMSAGRFEIQAARDGVDWDACPVSPEMAVEAWRDANPKIAGVRTGNLYNGVVCRRGGIWRDLEAAASSAITAASVTSVNKTRWKLVGADLHCTLPSGRKLVYFDARVEETKTPWGQRRAVTFYRRGERESTYGGKLTENVVQAISRDLLADAMLRLERAGLPVVLHVHDEIVCELDSEADLHRMVSIMSTPPEWAEDLPIDVEGAARARFQK